VDHNRIGLFWHTLKHVKFTQLYHQVYYRLKNRVWKGNYTSLPGKSDALYFTEGIFYQNSYSPRNNFEFLNLERSFDKVDWNYSDFGKLWIYNLNYFDYLNQLNISKADGLELIKDFISQSDLKDGLEPYPISLRGINWIKFLSRYGIKDSEIDTKLYQDYQRLCDNLEYHLLANHLLENGFSLLFGAYYFQDEELYEKAQNILAKQLKEQILKDGAHYELSPMYHQIILHRVLDCYNLVYNNSWKKDRILARLEESATKMLGWLEAISFENGEIPMLNDSAEGIAPTSAELQKYATDLGLNWDKQNLGDSGYRKFEVAEMEVVMDVGQIAPAYQPGHSHADNLQFVLNYRNEPVIVDTGISTYEKNARRHLERSTVSHNTVTINDLNSSIVWGGFRVAERAITRLLKDASKVITASHNGYRKLGVEHERSFQIQGNKLQIVDNINGKVNVKAKGHLHFRPQTQLELKGQSLIINGNLKISLSNTEDIKLEEYMFAEAFNTLIPAQKLTYTFKQFSTITITPFS
jgi:hypothetical protein